MLSAADGANLDLTWPLTRLGNYLKVLTRLGALFILGKYIRLQESDQSEVVHQLYICPKRSESYLMVVR